MTPEGLVALVGWMHSKEFRATEKGKVKDLIDPIETLIKAPCYWAI